jgi:hypothetical protein
VRITKPNAGLRVMNSGTNSLDQSEPDGTREDINGDENDGAAGAHTCPTDVRPDLRTSWKGSSAFHAGECLSNGSTVRVVQTNRPGASVRIRCAWRARDGPVDCDLEVNKLSERVREFSIRHTISKIDFTFRTSLNL